MIVRYIFFLAVGIFGLIGTFAMPEIAMNNFSPENSKLQNILFRLSLINFSLILVSVPFLMNMGIVSANYYEEDKRGKAKSEFTIISLAIPGIAMLAYVFFSSSDQGNMVLVFLLLVGLYRYLECIYLLFINK